MFPEIDNEKTPYYIGCKSFVQVLLVLATFEFFLVHEDCIYARV